ncbi:hypothetical protein [Erwinia sp.]|uniref:hypothetical protein n=1 Tax=Erwinia citreus TaxID=558 RepID=UPI003C72E9F1
MKNKTAAIYILLIISGSHSAWSIRPSQIELEVTADSVARIALYYQDKPVAGNRFDFYLPVNGLSQKFEHTSAFFHIVGNVEKVSVAFEEQNFYLHQVTGGSDKVTLAGGFIFRGVETDASKLLQLPVIHSISQATTHNGIKVHFTSEFLAGRYTKGHYANTFTLLLTPVI